MLSGLCSSDLSYMLLRFVQCASQICAVCSSDLCCVLVRFELLELLYPRCRREETNERSNNNKDSLTAAIVNIMAKLNENH